MTIVAISGNHDGQRKLKVERNLLRYINVHIINEPASTPTDKPTMPPRW